MREPKVIYGAYIRGIYGSPWVICGEYLCGFKIIYGLVSVYIFVSGLMKLGPENLYLNNDLILIKSLSNEQDWYK